MQTRKRDQDVDARVGSAISVLRTRRKLSQRGLAAHLTDAGFAIDASAVSRIEKGTRSLRLNEAVIVANVLQIELDWLVSADTPEPERELRELLSSANEAVDGASLAITSFYEAFLSAKEHLERHPEVLPLLEDPRDDGSLPKPTTADEYLPWLAARMLRDAEANEGGVFSYVDPSYAENQADADAVKALAQTLAGLLIQVDPDEYDDEDDDGEHPEEA